MKSIILTYIFALLLVCCINAKAIISVDSYKEDPIDTAALLDEGNVSADEISNYLNFQNLKRNILYYGDKHLDVYYNKNNVDTKKKVVIFVYGGSWVTGDKIKYTKFGSLLQRNGYVAVLPDYHLYPDGTVEDMVSDIYNAIRWTYNNIENFGGDPEQITISAHSAGSHITALTIVKSTLQLKNNGITLQPLPYIQKAVLMNGPYEGVNNELIVHALGTSVENVFRDLLQMTRKNQSKSDPRQAVLFPQFLLKYLNNKSISPTILLQEVADHSIQNAFNVGHFTFYYTSFDEIIPKSNALNLISEINRTSTKDQCSYVYQEGFKHSTLVFGIRDGEAEYENIFLDLIKNK